jgi:hypothetical protein
MSRTGLSPAVAGHSRPFRYESWYYRGPTTPKGEAFWFGLLRVRSPLLTESLLFSFPPGNEMFQFPGLAREFRDRYSFDSSPGLFAVFHALQPSSA